MNKNTHRHVLFVAQAGIIAALYVVLTWLSALFGLSGQNAIQVRISEALCVLPYFTPAAVPGLTVGCLLANLLTGAAPLDVVFGTLATLLGAVGAMLLRKWRYFVPLPSILSNTIIVPFVVYYVYYGGQEVTLPYLFLTVFIGEVISVGVLGLLLLFGLDNRLGRAVFSVSYRKKASPVDDLPVDSKTDDTP